MIRCPNISNKRLKTTSHLTINSPQFETLKSCLQKIEQVNRSYIEFRNQQKIRNSSKKKISFFEFDKGNVLKQSGEDQVLNIDDFSFTLNPQGSASANTKQNENLFDSGYVIIFYIFLIYF